MTDAEQRLLLSVVALLDRLVEGTRLPVSYTELRSLADKVQAAQADVAKENISGSAF